MILEGLTLEEAEEIREEIRKRKEQECKKCGRVFGSVRCFDVDCPNNTPNYCKRNKHNIVKTFEELNVGDTIYYYTKRAWKGPSDVKSYTLVQPICDRYWTPITEVDIYYEGDEYGNWYETIECNSKDTSDTVVLDKGYGELTIKVFTTLEEAEKSRMEYIHRLIKSHEESIIKLKEMV